MYYSSNPLVVFIQQFKINQIYQEYYYGCMQHSFALKMKT